MASAKGDPTPVEDASSVLHEAIPIGERDGFGMWLLLREARKEGNTNCCFTFRLCPLVYTTAHASLL